MTRTADTATEAAIVVVPADEVPWGDVLAVLGTRGPAARCQCQRYKLRRRESSPISPTVPVGWCAVEPRTAYEGLIRNNRVPWLGRTEDKADDGVWAVTCLYTRVGHRRRGVSRALARAAVDIARRRGARALEAYPITTTSVVAEDMHVGVRSVFVAAGLAEVSAPTPRRVVMRIDLTGR